MHGPDDKPLLVLSREGEGRVALLLSDHIWLWARGYEGGGPHLDLLRRLSHWLMKQPDLEEEALRLVVRGRELVIERQTMADERRRGDADRAVGRDAARSRSQAGEPGLWRGAGRRQRARPVARHRRQAHRAGQCRPGQSARVRRGDLDHGGAGAAAPAPPAATRAVSHRAHAASTCRASSRVRSSERSRATDWIGLKLREASVVRGIGVLPVFAGLLGLLLLVGSLALTWAREGR